MLLLLFWLRRIGLCLLASLQFISHCVCLTLKAQVPVKWRSSKQYVTLVADCLPNRQALDPVVRTSFSRVSRSTNSSHLTCRSTAKNSIQQQKIPTQRTKCSWTSGEKPNWSSWCRPRCVLYLRRCSTASPTCARPPIMCSR